VCFSLAIPNFQIYDWRPIMTPKEWQQARQILHEALERPPDSRAAFVTESCSGDDALRGEVEALLAAYEKAGNVLQDPLLKTSVRYPHISIGMRLGPYEVKALIGAGGMGEVYRAHDSRLGRDVAVKILPSAFTGDHHRLARFDREARVLATLSHTNIGAIYGVEDAPTDEGVPVRALVLELVEGETLAERITRSAKGKGRPLRLDEVLIIARQIAEALEVAHEKGIVHRDLKPANIKITPEGIVKILDFGLAKAAAGEVPESLMSEASTATLVGSHEGHVVGTAAYMSPEQARGAAVDKRSDIWALGCVLFEMLSGRALFGRETVRIRFRRSLKAIRIGHNCQHRCHPPFATSFAAASKRIRSGVFAILVTRDMRSSKSSTPPSRTDCPLEMEPVESQVFLS
jgi:eukaryotic-like serine/threonine-protein kinase